MAGDKPVIEDSTEVIMSGWLTRVMAGGSQLSDDLPEVISTLFVYRESLIFFSYLGEPGYHQNGGE